MNQIGQPPEAQGDPLRRDRSGSALGSLVAAVLSLWVGGFAISGSAPGDFLWWVAGSLGLMLCAALMAPNRLPDGAPPSEPARLRRVDPIAVVGHRPPADRID
jgi:hypothetical protein